MARYNQPDFGFEVRAGVFAPSFWIGELTTDFAAGPRLHIIKRESITGFITARTGFWALDKEVSPMASAGFGADFLTKRVAYTVEAGGGVVWGGQFNDPGFAVVGELNLYAAWRL